MEKERKQFDEKLIRPPSNLMKRPIKFAYDLKSLQQILANNQKKTNDDEQLSSIITEHTEETSTTEATHNSTIAFDQT